MSSIHALQSSTTSRKLLESVHSLRPLSCEALRTSGCYTIEIHEQDPAALHSESQQLQDVKHSNSQYYIGKAPSSDMHHVQHGNHPWHVGAQTHNYANEGDAVRRIVDVDEYGHYHNAHHHEYIGNYEDVYHQEFGQRADAIRLSDAHHHGYGHIGHGAHEYGFRSNSIIASMDSCLWHQQIYAYHNHHLQQYHNHHLHQQIYAYHNHHDLQQQISSETTDFLNTILFEAPASYIEGNNESNNTYNKAFGASIESINISNEVLNAQDRSRFSTNNVIEVLEAHADHKAVNCKELPNSNLTPKSCNRKLKGPPKIMSKLCESDGANIKEG